MKNLIESNKDIKIKTKCLTSLVKVCVHSLRLRGFYYQLQYTNKMPSLTLCRLAGAPEPAGEHSSCLCAGKPWELSSETGRTWEAHSLPRDKDLWLLTLHGGLSPQPRLRCAACCLQHIDTSQLSLCWT